MHTGSELTADQAPPHPNPTQQLQHTIMYTHSITSRYAYIYVLL